jgi:hypothetical protein
MANITAARAIITAHKVGPELQKYIEAARDSDYDILGCKTPWSDGYQLTKSDETWTFRGWSNRREAYRNNLDGYFGGGAGWFGADSECPARLRELTEAVERTGGYVSFAWTEYDSDKSISYQVAHFGMDDGGKAALSRSNVLRSWDYSLPNLMDAFDFTLKEAIEEYSGEMTVDDLPILWLMAHYEAEKSLRRAEVEWLEALREVEHKYGKRLRGDVAKRIARYKRAVESELELTSVEKAVGA